LKKYEEADTYRGKSVLITGGLGFIGSNLARRLVRLGAKVTLADSLIPEYGGNRANIADISSKVEVNITDVRDSLAMSHLVRSQDFLFNLAGQTSHLDSMTDPHTDLEINCRAQLSILEACRKENPEIRIVFASTRQIYGKPDRLPVDENHILRPTDVNGINKMAGEWYHILYSRVYGIRACSLRLTNTYGPGMRIKDARQTFLGIWIRKVLEGQPFEIWEGGQKRDFTYVDDCVEAMSLAASHPDAAGEIFNLGGCEVVTLQETGDLLCQLEPKGRYKQRSFPPERKAIDIGDFYADFSKIRSRFGWVPKIKLRSGLEKTLDYYRKRLPEYL
jgi:nucleoside-diphosphate-sugar epimerase